jgi:hypothetical protein
MAKYEIDGVVLYHLLVDNFKYETLCLYGEDQYAVGERFEMAKAMCELPWNQGRSITDMLKFIDEKGYDVEQLVQDQIDAFWEGDKI